jgi:hypothetical protein
MSGTQIHKTHHSPNLEEITTFSLVVFFVPSHGTNTGAPTCPSTPKVLSNNERAPTPSPSVVFNFGLIVESIKEFGGVSFYVNYNLVWI